MSRNIYVNSLLDATMYIVGRKIFILGTIMDPVGHSIVQDVKDVTG